MKELGFRMKLEILITEREGMIAENKARELRGEALAFHGDDFFTLQLDISKLLEEFKRSKVE